MFLPLPTVTSVCFRALPIAVFFYIYSPGCMEMFMVDISACSVWTDSVNLCSQWDTTQVKFWVIYEGEVKDKLWHWNTILYIHLHEEVPSEVSYGMNVYSILVFWKVLCNDNPHFCHTADTWKNEQSLKIQLLLSTWNNSIRKDCLKYTLVLILLLLSHGLCSLGIWKLSWCFFFFKCII
jgi:hypothetical protein